MHCCENCFKDVEIKAIVKGNGDFCLSSNVCISNITENEYLKETFETLLDVYTPITNIGNQYPKEKSNLLKTILKSQWNIFHLDADEIYKFLINLFPEKYQEQADLFDSPVGIAGSIDNEYLNKYSLLGNN